MRLSLEIKIQYQEIGYIFIDFSRPSITPYGHIITQGLSFSVYPLVYEGP